MEGKTVLISGTSTGIGYATAVLMAKEGWIVFAGVRKEKDFEHLRQSHPNICPLYLDVTIPDQISDAVATVAEKVGDVGLTALVNNSGGAHSGPMECVSIESLQAEFDVNLFGTYRLSQAALPLLRKGKPGRIINVGSFLGVATIPFSSAYCGTKHALEALTTAMRQELAPSSEAALNEMRRMGCRDWSIDSGSRSREDEFQCDCLRTRRRTEDGIRRLGRLQPALRQENG